MTMKFIASRTASNHRSASRASTLNIPPVTNPHSRNPPQLCKRSFTKRPASPILLDIVSILRIISTALLGIIRMLCQDPMRPPAAVPIIGFLEQAIDRFTREF